MNGTSKWARDRVNAVAKEYKQFNLLVAKTAQKLDGYDITKLDAIVAKNFNKLIETSTELDTAIHDAREKTRLEREILAAAVTIKAAEKCIAAEREKPAIPLLYTAEQARKGKHSALGMPAEPLGTSHLPQVEQPKGILQMLEELLS